MRESEREGGELKVTKKDGEGKCSEGRLRRKWRNFPAVAVCYSFLSLPPVLSPAPLRETYCIIHDFVNVACRCIFTTLYLEKFPRAGETRYRGVRVHASGVPERHPGPVYIYGRSRTNVKLDDVLKVRCAVIERNGTDRT